MPELTIAPAASWSLGFPVAIIVWPFRPGGYYRPYCDFPKTWNNRGYFPSGYEAF